MARMEDKFVSTYVRFVSGDSASFEEYLLARRDAKTTVHYPLRFGGYPLFYPLDPAVKKLVGKTKEKNEELKRVLSDLPLVAERELLRSCLVEEVVQTNEIEGVFSTRKDVYRILDDVKPRKTEKIRSIANKYSLLLCQEPIRVLTLKDIREQYDQLMEGALKPEDFPDGELFRKGPVTVTDGVKTIHNGLYPEERIQQALSVFLAVANGDGLSPWERLFVCHYIFEYTHPFYDGNGRCGRYLMTLFALADLPKVIVLRLSTAIGKRKGRYYKAFERTQDVRNRSDLSTFVYPNIEILLEEYQSLLDDIFLKKEQSKVLRKALMEAGESLEGNPVLKALADATSFSSFGLRVEDLVSETSLSVATVNRVLKSLSDKGWLIKEKNGYQSYFRLNVDAIG